MRFINLQTTRGWLPLAFAVLAVVFAWVGWKRVAAVRDPLAGPVPPDRETLHSRDDTRTVIVDIGQGAEPADAARALEAARLELGDAPRMVLDAHQSGREAVEARLQLERRTPDLIISDRSDSGEWNAGNPAPVHPERVPKLIQIESRAIPKNPFDTISAPLRVAAGRAFRMETAGPPSADAGITISLDGGEARKPRLERHGGSVSVLMDPLTEGTHTVAFYSGPGAAPVNFSIQSTGAPLVYTDLPEGFIAKALRAQGFVVKPWPDAAGGSLERPAVVVVETTRVDEQLILQMVESGAGLWVSGRAAIDRAAVGIMRDWIPARAVRPAAPPVATPEPAEESDPEGESDASPVDPPADTTNPTTPDTPPGDTVPTPASGDSKVVPTSEPAPVVALALVIDRSGSMYGEKLKLAKQSAISTAELLAPDDLLCLISFNETSRVEYRTDIAGSPDKIRAMINRMPSPDGGTVFYPALVDAANQLRNARASIRHIILLTDGATSDRFTSDYHSLIQRTIRQAGMTLSTVFVVGGGEEDPEFVTLLARWGGGRSYPASPQQIPALVSMEVRRVAGIPEGKTRRGAGPAPTGTPPTGPPEVKKEPPPAPKEIKKEKPPKKPAPPRPVPRENVPVTARLAPVVDSTMTRGIDFTKIPPLRAFCNLEARAGAAVLLKNTEKSAGDPPETPPPYPILALAAGTRVAVSGIEPGPGGWAEFTDVPGMRDFAGRLAGALSPQDAPSGGSALEIRAVAGSLEASRGTPDGLFPNHQEFYWSGSFKIGVDGVVYSSLRALFRRSELAEFVEGAIQGLSRGGRARAAGASRPAGSQSGGPDSFVYYFAACLAALVGVAITLRTGGRPG